MLHLLVLISSMGGLATTTTTLPQFQLLMLRGRTCLGCLEVGERAWRDRQRSSPTANLGLDVGPLATLGEHVLCAMSSTTSMTTSIATDVMMIARVTHECDGFPLTGHLQDVEEPASVLVKGSRTGGRMPQRSSFPGFPTSTGTNIMTHCRRTPTMSLKDKRKTPEPSVGCFFRFSCSERSTRVRSQRLLRGRFWPRTHRWIPGQPVFKAHCYSHRQSALETR